MKYASLASSYDGFTSDISYEKWAEYLESHFEKSPKKIKTVVDLACGTGSLTWILAQRGYEMIGVDISADMLSEAMEKGYDIEGDFVPPMFLCQPMEQLDLYGTVDALICTLDSVNHVLDEKAVAEAFRLVELFLEPGGLFVFDILTKSHFESLHGGIFLDETEDAYCVWRSDFDDKESLCTYVMDLFLREGKSWKRQQEIVQERAYDVAEIEGYLRKAGFVDIARHEKEGEYLGGKEAATGRVFFTAKKKG